MKPFLEDISEYLYRNHKDELGNAAIIFPNRRASLYFRRFMALQLRKDNCPPIWSPSFITINELMVSLSDKQTTESTILLLELYEIYKSVTGIQESFEDFYFWGEMLINDFDEIDKNLVNTKQLYSNISAIKEIEKEFFFLTQEQTDAINEFWSSFSSGEETEIKKKFINIWNHLHNVYENYNSVLDKKGYVYEGMIYRDVAERIKKDEDIHLPCSRYFLVGFNALNKCEHVLFDYLLKNNKAEFFWDYDTSFFNSNKDESHSAGHFIEKNLKLYPPPLDFEASDKETPQNSPVIKIYSAPSNIMQAKTSGSILSQIKTDTEDPNETAMVLADETLLMPLLYSLPEETNDINVTMGYPASNTAAFSLVRMLCELQRAQKTNTEGKTLLYHKYVTPILNHSYTQYICAEEARHISRKIVDEKLFYISSDIFPDSGFLSLIFHKKTDIKNISEWILDILHFVASEINSREDKTYHLKIESEFIFHIYTAIQRLSGILKKIETEIKINTYISLFNKTMRSISVPFSGEPLRGIQIMGLLETRTLDFKNLIILSLNEGVLPPKSRSHSYIPHNLRKGFGLPTMNDRDYIYSYYFYRLLQRAENVHLVYNSNESGMATGEKSRFILQLQHNTMFHTEENNIPVYLKTELTEPIEVAKNQSMLSRLDRFIDGKGEKNLSPSAINTYIDCKLKFYYRYVCELYLQEKLTEEIEPTQFGNIIHSIMGKLYKPFVDKEISGSDIEKIQKDRKLLEETIAATIYEEFKSGQKVVRIEQLDGFKIIMARSAYQYIQRLLKYDSQYSPFTIKCVESHVNHKIKIRVGNNDIYINTGGIIDRCDIKNNVCRVLDYKTGNQELKFESVASLFVSYEKRNYAAFQTLLYSYIFKSSNDYSGRIVPGLIILKELHENSEPSLRYKPDISQKNLVSLDDFCLVEEEFMENLIRTIEEIFNLNVPFTQTEDEKICSRCDYCSFCRR